MLKRVLLLSCLLAPCSIFALAQSSRTWVSGVGSDANPCSRTQPCATFAGALASTAAGGEIDALDEGDFGPVTITQSVTIDGGRFGGIVVSHQTAITVNATAGDVVVLRNLSINGLFDSYFQNLNNPGSGIRFNQGGTLVIQHCRIANTLGAVYFSPNVAGAMLSIEDTKIEGGDSAVYILGGSVFLDNVYIDLAGGYADGILARAAYVYAHNLTFSGSVAGDGQFGPDVINLDHCTIGTVETQNGAIITMNDSDIGSIDAISGSVLSYGNNRLHGTPTGMLTLY